MSEVVEDKRVMRSDEERRGSVAINDIIESDTFTSTGERLGMGCWGVVDVYTDLSGQRWAMKIFQPNSIGKEQMEMRGWTEESVMRNEAIPLDAAHHNVVPRLIERDKKGKMFVAMPVYDRTLESRINYLDLKEALEIARDIATALSYLHGPRTLQERTWGYVAKAHGDVKPSNIFLKDKRGFLGDLGSTTCISIGSDFGDVRGVHGDKNYRAPECYKEDSHPSTRADIWSLGAIVYQAVTNNGIYEGDEELPFMKESNANKILKAKIKKAPRKVRKFLRKCLAFDEHQRFANGSEALSELEKVIEGLSKWNSFKKFVKTSALVTLPVAILSAAVYGEMTYEPKKLDMPKTYLVRGFLDKPSSGEFIEFDAEEINDLPEAHYPLGILDQGIVRDAKGATENRTVAYLVKTHMQAAIATNGRFWEYSEPQFRAYMAYTFPEERQGNTLRNANPGAPIIAKSVEVALQNSKNGNGRADLEDVCAISRLGVGKVDEAKRAARSLDYRLYRDAKDARGKLIIPKEERAFIDQGLSYFHADVG